MKVHQNEGFTEMKVHQNEGFTKMKVHQDVLIKLQLTYWTAEQTFAVNIFVLKLV